MSLPLSMVFRRLSAIFFLVLASLIVLLSLTPCWYVMVRRIEQRVNSNSQNVLSEFQSEIDHFAKLLYPLNLTSVNLARILSSTLNETNISLSDIQTKVAPMLFQAFETVPFLTEISYIGMEGLFFSYCTDHDQALALYSKSSFSSISGASGIAYYVQSVNRDTGRLYGEASLFKYSMNTSWIEEVVNSSYGHSSVGSTWSESHDILYLSSVRISKTGIISLGFPASVITEFVTQIGRQGSLLYLATKDGKVLVQEIQHTHIVFSNDKVLFQSVKPNGNQLSYEGSISCNNQAFASVLNIGDAKYLTTCSKIDIMGIESVYVLGVPQTGLVSFVNKSRKQGLVLLSVMIVMILISILSFVLLNAIVGRREMHLCASLIKQMEATQQAERKSMNKSVAVASASHDVRASLAGLIGLIEMSHQEVLAGSELDTNLKQMGACTKDLLGLLNSILDTSKIEAGKMQLEEEEFDLCQLIEDAIDLYHPVAMKKGVDIVLDHYDGSIIKYSRVKGDRGKLKQVLCNLLSNAVKFTDEGYITVRVWVQKPSFQNSIIATNKYSFMKHLSCLCYKKNEAEINLKSVNSVRQDLNCLEFVFEVDDTGKGIPKEKHKSVFENYVQVKETSLGQGGTGLGLGIVQSLVRLMHGDIVIVDKDIGEKGTCFRFSALLTVCEIVTGGSSTREVNNDLEGDKNLNHSQRLEIRTPSSGSSMCSLSPRLPVFTSSRPEASRVVLLIQNVERQKTTQKFMESLGIKVYIVKQWEHLFHTLKKMKQKGSHSSQSSKGTPDLSCRSASQNSIGRTKGVPLSASDGKDDEASLGFVLIVIDAIAGPVLELRRIVSEFRRGLGNPCKVVWLNKALVSVEEDVFDLDDIVMSKPFHGSRLFQVIRLLPEYGGNWHSISSGRSKKENFHDRFRKSIIRDSWLSKYHSPVLDRTESSPTFQDVEQGEYGSSSRTGQSKSYGGSNSKARNRNFLVDEGEIQECGDSSNDNKPLSGKKFLVAEDTKLFRRIALKTLIQLGATNVEECQNGEQAVKLVEEGLTGAFPNLPFDYILMDCEMPLVNGFEATKRIRDMEKAFGVHIPIIALTAHTSRQHTNMIREVGMDVHLSKPLREDLLLKTIRYIDTKQ